MFYDDEYPIEYEPSIADEILSKATTELFETAKGDIANLVKRTQTENERLLAENEKLFKQAVEIKGRERKLKEQETDLSNRAKRMPVKEFFGQRSVVMYFTESKRQPMPPKCNLCDDKRARPYTTPLGRKEQEPCPCSIVTSKFEPQEKTLTDLRKDRGDGALLMWFRTSSDEGYSSGQIIKNEDVYNGSTPFDQLERYHTYFNDKEQCQLYCDWLNDK